MQLHVMLGLDPRLSGSFFVDAFCMQSHVMLGLDPSIHAAHSQTGSRIGQNSYSMPTFSEARPAWMDRVKPGYDIHMHVDWRRRNGTGQPWIKSEHDVPSYVDCADAQQTGYPQSKSGHDVRIYADYDGKSRINACRSQ